MIRPDKTVFVYNATTGEYFSLGAGWDSTTEVIEYANSEGYVDTETQEGIIGVEEGHI